MLAEMLINVSFDLSLNAPIFLFSEDSYLYQQENNNQPRSGASSFLHHDSNFFSLFTRTRTLLLQTLVLLVITVTLFH